VRLCFGAVRAEAYVAFHEKSTLYPAAFYNENSFWYFTDANYSRFVPEIKCRFQASRLVTYFPSEWHQKHNISYVSANLIAIKDDELRNGGLLNI
jgi:hypothetical protein